MNQDNSKTGFYAAILFLVWPFVALISAFRNYRRSWAKNVLWAFVAFYGFAFAIGAENDSADIVRYVEQYQELHQTEMTITKAQTYFVESGEIDIVKTVIAVVLSRFTNNQAVLTLLYGIIFGFFFSRNMWFVLERLDGELKLITILLFLSFFLVVPIWDMNGFRMWTAAHIFIYGLLPFLFENKKSGAIISSLAVLVHFSFIVPVGILVVYILLGNRLVIYFVFFLATFFISEINLVFLNDIIENYAPEILQERTAGYRSEGYVETYREGTGTKNIAWYAIWYSRALKWSVMGFLVVLFFKDRTFFNKHKEWLSLFSFTLLFYGVANLLSSLPSGGRFIAVTNLFALALIILYVQNHKYGLIMERFVWAATPALLLYIIVAIRIGLYSMSATSILGNPVIAFFMTGEHVSLNDVMRMIL